MKFFEKKGSISQIFQNVSLKSEFTTSIGQSLKLLIHKELGKILVIDDEIQHVEAWSSFYHESIVHIPISLIPEVKRVLILGGGSLYAAKEILKYQSVMELVMIDHDPEVIKLISENYTHAKSVLEDQRLRIKYNNLHEGFSNEGKFDLIINDAIDLYNQPNNKDSYKKILNALNDNGLCSDLIYRHIFEKETTINSINLLFNISNPVFSMVAVPEYPGIMHLLTIWGKLKDLNQNSLVLKNEIQKEWQFDSNLNPCEYYNPRFTDFYFYLPPYLKRLFPKLQNKVPSKS